MQLTLHADYALRVLLYLGSAPEGTVASTRAVSRSFGISRHHLVRVVQTLAQHGYVTVSSGRAGGVSLARNPREIGLGDVIRDAETNLKVVECFDEHTNSCPIISVCQLKPVLHQALQAFLSVMDRYTLADMVARNRGPNLVRVLRRPSAAQDAPFVMKATRRPESRATAKHAPITKLNTR